MYDFLHTADIHFGKYRGLPDYLERQKQSLIWIYETAIKYNIPTVVIAGDIYEKIVVKDLEREAFTNTLLTYDKKGITTLLINGNHDWMTESMLSIWDLLMLQENGKFKNTFIITGNPSKITLNDQEYLCIPNRGYHHDYSTKELTQIMGDMCTEKTVVILHELVNGSIADSGFKFKNRGCKITNKTSLYVALGDIHKYQKMKDRQFYCGSPIQHSPGDTLPKGVLLVNTDEPNNPLFVESTHIKPFITTNNPDDLTKDAYITYTGVTDNLPLAFSDNVINIKNVTKKSNTNIIKEVSQWDLLDGLNAFLINEGLSEIDSLKGIKIIEDIIIKEKLNS